MTEKEWNSCTTKPSAMWGTFGKKASGRKSQLIACAICRLLPLELLEDGFQHALTVTENFAEGRASSEEFLKVVQDVSKHCNQYFKTHRWENLGDAEQNALRAIDICCGTERSHDAVRELLRQHQVNDVIWFSGKAVTRLAQKKLKTDFIRSQCDIIRDIVPYPRANHERGLKGLHLTGTTRVIAEGIELRFDRLPILADALEDDGFQDEIILHHLRNGKDHYRGCWALDLILGKS